MTPLGTIDLLASSEEKAGGIAALGLDPLAIIAQGVTFLILLWLIKKFALGRIVKVLEDRRKTIGGSLDQAEELKKQNEAAEKRLTVLMHQARKDAEDIIEKSHTEAGAIIQEAEDAAVAKAEKIAEDGKKQIAAEVVKAKADLKKDTLELVSRVSTALLGETVDARKHETLVKNALKDEKS